MPSLSKIATAAAAGMFAVTSVNMPANALTKTETNSLSYEQVKGSGLANRCPTVVGEESITLSSGKKYKVTDLCIEPVAWQVLGLSRSRCRFLISV
jgi:photosystem II oxygen-evolving enhancer protein 1